MGFFGGGGSSVDLASPPAIGSTTPNTGAFTTLSATNRLSISAGSTINNGIRFTGTGGDSGRLAYNGYALYLHFGQDTTNNPQCQLGDNIGVRSNGSFCFSNSTLTADATKDVFLRRDAAGVLAQYNGTSAQTFRLYNTFTDASNYERGFFRWNTNVLEIGAEAAGTGTQRQLRLPLGTVTASTPLSVTQTWNGAGVTFTGIQANITDTASASGSYLMDLQVGGATKFRIGKGSIHYIGGNFVNAGTSLECYFSEAAALSRTVSSRVVFFGQESSVGMAMSAGYGISWSSNSAGSGDCFASRDLFLLRDGSGVLGQRNGANAQTFRLYRTFTDASNYERLGFLATNTTRYTITSENAGTGSARSLEVSFYTSASDPTSTDITSGCFGVWKNSGTGTIKLWANDGGTMKSVALA